MNQSPPTPSDDGRALLLEPHIAQRAAEMLTAYAELIKATGKYAEMHYIPEVEYIANECRTTPRGDDGRAPQPVVWEQTWGCAPPLREATRIPLSEQQLDRIFLAATGAPDYSTRIARAIERAHGIVVSGDSGRPAAPKASTSATEEDAPDAARVTADFPIIAMGHGKVEVMFTFSNIQGLEAIEFAVARLRAAIAKATEASS
jgi:hypothetical protein